MLRIGASSHGESQLRMLRVVRRGDRHDARDLTVACRFEGDFTEAFVEGRTATVLLNPGRIGLTAVDALALRIPIVTTSTALHGPEAEYLIHGESVFATADDPSAFVEAALALDIAPLPVSDSLPTLGHMVDRFVSGTLAMLDADR